MFNMICIQKVNLDLDVDLEHCLDKMTICPVFYVALEESLSEHQQGLPFSLYQLLSFCFVCINYKMFSLDRLCQIQFPL